MSSRSRQPAGARPGEADRRPRGRGASTNAPGRFAVTEVVRDPDVDAGPPDDAPSPRTTVLHDATRTILARNDSPDVPFSVSVNPYRGCEHGCVYCFARPTHAYLDMSPGLDFETRIVAKPRAAELLRDELARPGYRPSPLALGSNTDPWQPVERDLRITRGVLEVLAEHGHPVVCVTKSALVTRDLDLLAPLAGRGLAAVYVSLTTLDASLAGSLEPRAAAPARRLDTVRRLAEAGVPVGVLVSPVIPAVNEPEIEAILAAARRAGAVAASYAIVRLPHEVAALVETWLREQMPDRADRVLARLRDLGDGRLYDSRFGRRGRGAGPWAELTRRRFEIAARREALAARLPELDTSQFRVPGRAVQRRLFR